MPQLSNLGFWSLCVLNVLNGVHVLKVFKSIKNIKTIKHKSLLGGLMFLNQLKH